ncbi:hypothetical protein COR50_18565 [Chitinophaga caeni]|uniref:Uncharacterized protein n=1 Tax=Chitinophaga caeni TaxID=2029983 RepID=A0A291QYI9_9BACT|nr:hypothetical protein COR50_18565 [Chitinophaga caeni]
MVVYAAKRTYFFVFDTILNVLNWAWVRAWKLEPAVFFGAMGFQNLSWKYAETFASSSFQARTPL